MQEEEHGIVEVVDEETGEVVSTQKMSAKLEPRVKLQGGEYNRKIPRETEILERKAELKAKKKARRESSATSVEDQMEAAREQWSEAFSMPLSRPQRRAARRAEKRGGVGYTKKRGNK